MIFELVTFAQSYLQERNVPPLSFHAQMLMKESNKQTQTKQK